MKNGVTVIIPSYNYGQFLTEAVDSALNQSLKPEKIIIIDDASDDNTEQIAKSYQKKYSEQISYIRNKKNSGTVFTYNTALEEVKTEYYCILDADNIYIDSYLEKTKKVLDKNANIAIVYSDYELFGPRAEIVFYDIDWNKDLNNNGKYLIHFPDFDWQLLNKKNFIDNSALVRTDLARKAGGYKNDGDYEIDHDLFIRILKENQAAFHIPEPLLRYRQHTIKQTSAKYYLKEKYENGLLKEKTKEELIEEYILLEKKIITLEKNLYKITSAKFYKLWQKYCKLRDSILNKL